METKVDDSAHASLLKANQDHFDEQATKWDDDPEYIKVSRESYSTIMHHLGRFLLSSPPSSSSSREVDHPITNVLNFGCGTGLLEAQLRFNVTSITGVDISKGMIDRMRHKIQQESWSNVTALQMDILDNAQTTPLPVEGFDMIISCYTFHHLQDVTAIGRALLKYLKPDGYFCIIDFAAAATANAEHNHTEHHHEHHDHQEVHEHQKRHHAGDKLSEAAKASIGTHDGFSKSFLIDYYQTVLGLENVIVEDATPLYYDGMEYPTIVAYGRRRSGGGSECKIEN